MPKKIEEIKEFLLTTRRNDVKAIRIKRTKDITKFKIKCARQLYTYSLKDQDKIKKIREALPKDIVIEETEVKKKRKSKPKNNNKEDVNKDDVNKDDISNNVNC